jgi:predicted NBD/HSP70 family sugar kinase
MFGTPLASIPPGTQHQSRRIVELIARGTAISRSEIAKKLGLAPSTVSLRVQELVDIGVVHEDGVGQSRGGRRPRLLRLKEDQGSIMVGDVGGRHVRIGRLDLAGVLLDTIDLDVRLNAGPEETLRAIADAMLRMSDEAGSAHGRIRGVAIALPGPVNLASRSVDLPSRMPGWQGFRVGDWLENEFGVAAVVDNDANLMALGEHHAQLESQTHSITVKAGTAIGSGIIVNGAIHHGATGAAGDVTHTRIAAAGDLPCSCGNVGCLETVASGAGLVRQLSLRGISVASTAEVLALARDADPVATTLVRTAGTYLGEVLSSVVNFFNPHALFLSGGMASCEPFIAAVRSSIYEGCHPLVTQKLRIEPASTGPNAALLGGGRAVVEQMLFATDT